LLPACSYKNEIDSNYYCQKLKFSCVKKNKIALFKTSKGDFVVKLFGKDNPVTVSNFLQNVDKNIYVNKKFNKIIPITGLIMTKLDGTAKGGILLAVAKKYKLPIIALGLGEKEDDLQIFEAEKFAEAFTQIN